VPKVLRARDLPTVPLRSWKDIGDHAANKVREYVRGGILKGKYSKDYAEAKASRKAGPKGASISSTQTSFVDLTLTGKMLGELKRTKVGKDFVQIGLSGVNAAKAESNARRGYDLFDKKVLNRIEADIVHRIDKRVDSNVKEYERDSIEINIGK